MRVLLLLALAWSAAAFANECCISCISQVHTTVCSSRQSQNTCTAVPDCRWSATKGCYSWMKDYCESEIPNVQRIQFKGQQCAVAEADWVYRRKSDTLPKVDRRPHTTAGLSGCKKFFMIYSGHGSVADYYTTFLQEIKEKNPDATEVVVADSSCQGMADPKKVREALTSVRAENGASYRIWGNQLNSSDDYFSWLGFELSEEGIKEKLWACDYRNSCKQDQDHSISQRTIGTSDGSMRCLQNGRATTLACCRDGSGRMRWSSSCTRATRHLASRRGAIAH